MKSNKSTGNKFETELCEMMSKYGFWCHNMTQNSAGQPADVIAVRNGKAHLIDCKVCENDRFPLSRIEENQRNAMELWYLCGNGTGWFALKTSEGIYFLSLPDLDRVKQKSLNLDEIKAFGFPWERWCECRFM